ncbi:hypothetical protein IMZ48_35835 [Candidatus Bathyarchaeota archaeon]|nr:hypothetical protein [Candidatus Bathyarchaeota archaeon]
MEFKDYTKTLTTNVVIHPETEIPAPENFSWAVHVAVDGKANLELDSVTKKMDKKIHMLERLARYEIAKVIRHHPVATTKKALERTVLNIEREFTRDSWYRDQQRGYDGGELACTSVRSVRTTLIRPPQALLDNIAIEPFFLTIGSINVAWQQVVLDAGSVAWHRTGEILEAWKVIAATVDKVNRKIFKGKASPDQCACPQTAPGNGSHLCFCGACGRLTVCSDMVSHNLGYRACGPCRQEKRSKKLAEAKEIAEDSLKGSLRKDKKKGGWNKTKHDLVVRDCLNDLLSAIITGDGGWYENYYAGGQLTMSPPQVHHPRIISIDAVNTFA